MVRQPPVLAVRQLVKRFGDNPVLNGVNFTVDRGEIVSVVGENGAGKSTLAKILAGVHQPDEGYLEYNGSPVELRSPRRALELGVGFIPQELAYVPEMTVGENVLLGRWPATGVFTLPGRSHAAAREYLDLLQVPVDPSMRMSELRLAEQQMVEIVKVVARGTQVLILDEPTAALSNAESDRLMAVLRDLAHAGAAIVLISHRFDEVLGVSDRVDVFRNGRRVHSGPPSELTARQLVAHMLGREVADQEGLERAQEASAGPAALTIAGLTHNSHPVVTNLNVEIPYGVVTCLFGVRGSGAEIVAEALTGRKRGVIGSLSLDGKFHRMFRSPAQAIAAGVTSVPPDRKKQGLVLGRTIAENMSYLVPWKVSTFATVSARRERTIAKRWLQALSVRALGPGQSVGELSGGNQQKVLLASRLEVEPTMLIVQEPTRGVDIGARAQIHDQLRRVAHAGAAVLVVTPDAEEAAAVADVVIVMRNGVVTATLSGAQITQAHILTAAAGEADHEGDHT